jgi:cytoskeletal protein RodZ
VSCRATFGERLRRHRERHGISLHAVSQQTKVSAAVFAALERGDCSRWPGGVYTRAYIRGYAAAVGLDPDEIAAEFAECFGGVPDRSAPGRPLRLSLEEDQRARTRVAVGRLVMAALDLGAIVAIAAGISIVSATDLWMTLAVGALTYYGAAFAATGTSPVGWTVQTWSGGQAPALPQEVPEDPPLGETVGSEA